LKEEGLRWECIALVGRRIAVHLHIKLIFDLGREDISLALRAVFGRPDDTGIANPGAEVILLHNIPEQPILPQLFDLNKVVLHVGLDQLDTRDENVQG
jgi:hypothetical protein